jgi:hypothetical protein
MLFSTRPFSLLFQRIWNKSADLPSIIEDRFRTTANRYRKSSQHGHGKLRNGLLESAKMPAGAFSLMNKTVLRSTTMLPIKNRSKVFKRVFRGRDICTTGLTLFVLLFSLSPHFH